jgi:vacuolar iron transporter family protein
MDDMKLFLRSQKNEITEYHIYSHLSKRIKDKHNSKILKHIANDEMRHYTMFKAVTKKDVTPNMFKVYFYLILSFVFGLSFSLKLMEKGEHMAQKVYKKLPHKLSSKLLVDEHRHEKELLDMLQEQKLEYAGSIVLGLNDALVELTGVLAGLTFALQNSHLIAGIGFITGFAAALSMGASEYLSSKEEDHKDSTKSPLRAAIYTGMTYLITVAILISPYFIFSNVFVALGVMISLTIFIIAFYTFYITTAKNQKFWKRFAEMALISLSVAIISFGIGLLVRIYFGVDM